MLFLCSQPQGGDSRRDLKPESTAIDMFLIFIISLPAILRIPLKFLSRKVSMTNT